MNAYTNVQSTPISASREAAAVLFISLCPWQFKEVNSIIPLKLHHRLQRDHLYYLLIPSLVKNGCLRASRAVDLSDGSYLSSPCIRCMRSPAEWSTCCIIKFWKTGIGQVISIQSSCRAKNLKESGSQTWRRGNFETALMLSLEAAPSGQSNLPFLTYLSACRLKNQGDVTRP